MLHITIPNSTEEAFLLGGRNGLVFVGDKPELSLQGHITSNPSEEPALTIQIPTANGKLPKHRLLHKGICTGDEYSP